ncbi:hypothetical protein N7492_009793 [Penicillium capsulatum]|uniref:Uncharacterized protein n=1 Tax=Penicillium capsulatum TaxID=69766 RepID=A0A9W9LFE6_9EURO|nr:hypothetical protein N7492_009793 [Penicillium capsulatum]
MRASAWNAFWNRLVAAAVVMALHGASCTLLGALTLECLMPNLLAIVTLRRSGPVFKDAGHAGFSASVKEPVGQQPPRPCDLGNGGVILLADDGGGFGSNLTLLVQNCGLVDAVDFDRVELVTKHPSSRTDLCFRHFLD